MPLSEDERHLILGMLWSLKASDQSILQACLQERGETQVGTTNSSGNDLFYSHLEQIGWAREMPLGIDPAPAVPGALDNLKTFSITEQGKAELASLIENIRSNGYPPLPSIIGAQAVRMLQRYAVGRDAQSYGKLGLLYEGGAGVKQDPERALESYIKAVEMGDVAAHNNVAMMYFSAAGIPKKIDAALSWFLKGAELGDLTSMNNLGEIHSRGLGVEVDYAQAFKWFSQAARLGHGPAIYKLALLYSTGHGAPQDYVQGYMWFTIAIAAGVDKAQEMRNTLATSMTPEQIKEAELLASQWAPGNR